MRLSIILLTSLLTGASSSFASSSCRDVLTSKSLFQSPQIFLSKIQKVRSPRLHWEVNTAGDLDLIDFARELVQAKPEEQIVLRKSLRQARNSWKDLGPEQEFKYELALMAFQDLGAWRSWIQLLIEDGHTEFEIRLVAPFFAKLPAEQQKRLIEILKSKWPSLSKGDHRSARLSPRRSADLFLAYQVDPRSLFDTLPPDQAYRSYLEKVLSFYSASRQEAYSVEKILSGIKVFEHLADQSREGSSVFLFGSFPNGRANEASDIDFVRYFPTPSILVYEQRVDPRILRKSLHEVLGRPVFASQAYYESHESALQFMLKLNWIVLELRKDRWRFHLSPYFQHFQSRREYHYATPTYWDLIR